MATSWPFRDPDEVLVYGFDWSPRFNEPGETLVSIDAFVQGMGDCFVENSDIGANGVKTNHLISGGTAGTTQLIKLVAVSNLGETYIQYMSQKVKVRT